MSDWDDLKRLVAHMHDSLCRCGGFCEGAQDDLRDFETYVLNRWGSTIHLLTYLQKLRDNDE